MRLSYVLAACSLLALGAPLAGATTIDFNNSSTTLTTYSENGYNVVATSGSWHGGGVYGNPSPSAFVDNPGGTLSFTLAAGGLFTFSAADLSTAQNGTSMTYDFIGLLNGMQIFSQAGTNNSSSFITFSSLYASSAIDTLSITLNSTTSAHFNVDNVVVNNAIAVTPEPSSLLLLGTGVLGAVGLLRRRVAGASA